jgi:rfaE bifunctional protein nucleotidyltransferase chain/domain
VENFVKNAARRLALAADHVAGQSKAVGDIGAKLASVFRSGGKVLVFGNGGSAACAQHFAAEFTGKLKMDRAPLPALALTVDGSALTAIANDYGYVNVFSRQVEALANKGDLVIGLTTSGSSANVAAALQTAKALGAVTVLLVGKETKIIADYVLRIPIHETARVQEAHDLLLHEIAQITERQLFDALGPDSSADPFPFELSDSHLEDFGNWIRTTGQTLATTNGVFDLLHIGHRDFLNRASNFGDRMVVLVNSDESVRTLKGPDRPVRGQQDRVRDLEKLPSVSHVFVFDELDPRSPLELLRPDVHIKGADYSGKPLIEQKAVQKSGGIVRIVDSGSSESTSLQINRLKS